MLCARLPACTSRCPQNPCDGHGAPPELDRLARVACAPENAVAHPIYYPGERVPHARRRGPALGPDARAGTAVGRRGRAARDPLRHRLAADRASLRRAAARPAPGPTGGGAMSRPSMFPQPDPLTAATAALAEAARAL